MQALGNGSAKEDPERPWTLWGPSEPWGGCGIGRAGVGAYDEGDATNRQSPPLEIVAHLDRLQALHFVVSGPTVVRQ
jgi:hypothetical protein